MLLLGRYPVEVLGLPSNNKCSSANLKRTEEQGERWPQCKKLKHSPKHEWTVLNTKAQMRTSVQELQREVCYVLFFHLKGRVEQNTL